MLSTIKEHIKKYSNYIWNQFKERFSISKHKYIYLLVLSVISFYFMFFNYIEVHQVAIKRNILSGETEIDSTAGLSLSAPWVFVSNIDTRPHRICVTSASRNFNCMLVSFDPKYYNEFINLEGFYYYWWANRISFNMGHDQEYRGMSNLIRGYAFDKTKRPFIKTHQDFGK